MDPNNQFVQQQNIQPKKEKKGCPIAIVIILAILAIGGIGFGVFELLKPEEKTKCIAQEQIEEKQQEGEKLEKDYTIYYELVNKYIDHSIYDYSFEKNGFNDENYMAEITIKAKNIDRNYISKKYLDDTIKELFNYDYNNVKKIELNCATYELDENIQDYVEKEVYGCGGTTSQLAFTTINSVEEKASELKITITHADVKYGPNDEGNAILQTMTDASGAEVYNETFTYEGEAQIKENLKKAEQYFEENLDKFSKYNLIFKKTDKHYYLESGEKIN